MNPILTIHRWSETFENADSRKRQRLKFFYAPSGCDSHGFVELMTCHQSAGIMALGVFQALCQLAATMPGKSRGRFVKSNGSAMTLRQIALLIRVEICHLENAVEILTGEEIAWLRWDGAPNESADNLPTICRGKGGSLPDAADNLPGAAGFVQGQGQGQGQVEDERERRASADEASPTLKKSTPEPIPFPDMPDAERVVPLPPRIARRPVTPARDEDWSTMKPTGAAEDMAQLQSRINDLHPTWKKRPTWVRSEMDILHANLRVFSELTEADWALLTIYMGVVVNPAWKLKSWQPDVRPKFLETVNDVLMRADEWAQECKRRKIPTGLETVGGVA